VFQIRDFRKLWELAEKKLTTGEINNKLQLGTDNEGRAVWHVVTKRAILSVFRNYGIGPKRNYIRGEN